MAIYAMVLVVQADDEAEAHTLAEMSLATCAEFVGEPWEVQPINADDVRAYFRVRTEHDDARLESVDVTPEYGTLECFDQHPER